VPFKFTEFVAHVKTQDPSFQVDGPEPLSQLARFLQNNLQASTGTATPQQIANELAMVPRSEWNRQSQARAYLFDTIPDLARFADRFLGETGISEPGYQAGKIYRNKDKDGRWHQFPLQGSQNSCGPSCVVMVKNLCDPAQANTVKETELKGLMALARDNQLHSGQSSLDNKTQAAYDWDQRGANRDLLLAALRAAPVPLPSSTAVNEPDRDKMLERLRKCSIKNPAIVGWRRQDSATGKIVGHWTVCIGPTKTKDELILLDPIAGIRYVANKPEKFYTYRPYDPNPLELGLDPDKSIFV